MFDGSLDIVESGTQLGPSVAEDTVRDVGAVVADCGVCARAVACGISVAIADHLDTVNM